MEKWFTVWCQSSSTISPWAQDYDVRRSIWLEREEVMQREVWAFCCPTRVASKRRAWCPSCSRCGIEENNLAVSSDPLFFGSLFPQEGKLLDFWDREDFCSIMKKGGRNIAEKRWQRGKAVYLSWICLTLFFRKYKVVQTYFDSILNLISNC